MNGRQRTGRALGLGLVGTVLVVVVAFHGASLLRTRAAATGEPTEVGVTGSRVMRPSVAPDRTQPPRFVPAPAPGDPVADPAQAASPPRRGDFEGNDE